MKITFSVTLEYPNRDVLPGLSPRDQAIVQRDVLETFADKIATFARDIQGKHNLKVKVGIPRYFP
jgi:hypothetical protein